MQGITHSRNCPGNDLIPLIALITFEEEIYHTRDYDSYKEAYEAQLPQTSIAGPLPIHVVMVYVGGRWVVEDVWWIGDLKDIESRHSTLTNKKDAIQDWWILLDGICK